MLGYHGSGAVKFIVRAGPVALMMRKFLAYANSDYREAAIIACLGWSIQLDESGCGYWHHGIFGSRQSKKPRYAPGAFHVGESGTDLLSRGIPRTIIGAAPFHGPVRDGKEWFRSAMGTRLNLSPRRSPASKPI